MTNVIINGRFLSRPITGVERYGWEITRAIDQLIATKHNVAKNLRFEIVRPKGRLHSEPDFEHIRTRSWGISKGHFWEQFELPIYAKNNLTLNLCNTGPAYSGQNITVIHDANVWLMPENFSPTFSAFYRIVLPRTIRNSRSWITVSNFAASTLKALNIADREPSEITPNGCDHMLRMARMPSNFAAMDLPKPYVFMLGSLSPNKNEKVVLRLATRLNEHGISIVLAGGANKNIFDGRAGGQDRQNVHRFGRLSDGDIAYLYSNSMCFAFPSLFEGFGIPPLEAMALGTPVVSSSTSALPEVLGNGALFCSPHDSDAWFNAFLRISRDDRLRQDLISAGRVQASRYTWQASAIRLLHHINLLLCSGKTCHTQRKTCE